MDPGTELGWSRGGSGDAAEEGFRMDPRMEPGWVWPGSGMALGMDPGRSRLAPDTHMVTDMLAADSGLTSATSFAFCSASFWLAASSSSCSSCKAPAPRPARLRDPPRPSKPPPRTLQNPQTPDLGELLCVGQVVHGDGQEDIQEGVWELRQGKAGAREAPPFPELSPSPPSTPGTPGTPRIQLPKRVRTMK